jgi:hypothetical protein
MHSKARSTAVNHENIKNSNEKSMPDPKDITSSIAKEITSLKPKGVSGMIKDTTVGIMPRLF